MKYALIKNSKVVNVIESSPEFNEIIQSQYDAIVQADNVPVFIGQNYQNGIFEKKARIDNRTWSEKRRDEYPSPYLVAEALIEKEMGRPEKLEEIKTLRQSVIDKYPKV